MRTNKNMSIDVSFDIVYRNDDVQIEEMNVIK